MQQHKKIQRCRRTFSQMEQQQATNCGLSSITAIEILYLVDNTIMNVRQKIQVLLLLLFIFFTFAAYHPGTGGTGWLQLLTVVTFLTFVLVFDCAFTNESSFIFDPDAENWRRKTVSFVCFCWSLSLGGIYDFLNYFSMANDWPIPCSAKLTLLLFVLIYRRPWDAKANFLFALT